MVQGVQGSWEVLPGCYPLVIKDGKEKSPMIQDLTGKSLLIGPLFIAMLDYRVLLRWCVMSTLQPSNGSMYWKFLEVAMKKIRQGSTADVLGIKPEEFLIIGWLDFRSDLAICDLVRSRIIWPKLRAAYVKHLDILTAIVYKVMASFLWRPQNWSPDPHASHATPTLSSLLLLTWWIPTRNPPSHSTSLLQLFAPCWEKKKFLHHGC